MNLLDIIRNTLRKTQQFSFAQIHTVKAVCVLQIQKETQLIFSGIL